MDAYSTQENVFQPGMSSEIYVNISPLENLLQVYDRTSERNPNDLWHTWSAMSESWCRFVKEWDYWIPYNWRLFLKLLGNRLTRRHNNLYHHSLKLKAHFARYGIPCQVISDARLPFTWPVFRHFSEKWDFEHLMESPGNQQANKKAESAVKSVICLMRKNKDTGTDEFLALLDFRNTSTQHMGSSPSQPQLNHRTRSLLPMSGNLLKPRSAKRTVKKTKYFLSVNSAFRLGTTIPIDATYRR